LRSAAPMDEGRAGITGCLPETNPTIDADTPPRGNVVSRRARDAMHAQTFY
jgi:hypothetical protein